MVNRIPESDSFGKMRAAAQDTARRLDDIERTDGSQYARALEKIKSLVSGLSDQVQAYINTFSMTTAAITAYVSGLSWLSVLAPAKGGTGTANAYSNTFSSGSWRATWSLSDGTLGYAPSLRELKQDIMDADIDVSAWLGLPVQLFRYRADVAENGDAAGWRLGFVAEDLEAAGLESWLYRDGDGELQGVAYEMVWAAHHEIIRQQQARIEELEGTLAGVLSRLAALEGA